MSLKNKWTVDNSFNENIFQYNSQCFIFEDAAMIQIAEIIINFCDNDAITQSLKRIQILSVINLILGSSIHNKSLTNLQILQLVSKLFYLSTMTLLTFTIMEIKKYFQINSRGKTCCFKFSGNNSENV